MHIKQIRYIIFLRDVARLSIIAFGGPQVHLAMFIDLLVKKRRYLKEKDLLELYALCQVLPGPTSSQTITALGFKIGGPSLAYLTLIVWSLPGVSLMILFGLLFFYLENQQISGDFMRFVQPIAVGLVCYAAFRTTMIVVNTRMGVGLMLASVIAAYFFRTPFVFPVVVVLGGLLTAINFRKQPKENHQKVKVKWGNFILFWGVLIFAAILGAITDLRLVKLFENFYRNGSFIYGGGQVLIPVLLTEFVQYKAYLTKDEFLSGYGLSQLAPGPVFSFTAFIGVLAMRDAGLGWQIAGGLVAAAGIFLPGTFIIFFVIRFWEQLKKYRAVKASLEGIHAASSGLVIAGAMLLFEPLRSSELGTPIIVLNIIIVFLTTLLLHFTKLSPPLLIFVGLVGGLVFQFLL
jgi:chromate transporter